MQSANGQTEKDLVLILIADDFAQWRFKVRTLLSPWPEWLVAEACDGLQAVRKAEELHPDIVLLDIGMPFLNGIEAAKRIRQRSPDSNIIFVTQNDEPEIKSAALATGAQCHLLKTTATTALVPAIRVALKNERNKRTSL